MREDRKHNERMIHMKLESIQAGTYVVATDEYYEGLVGVIEEVRSDKSTFETENETELEIVVNLIETQNMDVTHPDLNGTSTDLLIMGEDELIFFPDGLSEKGRNISGETFELKNVIHKSEGYGDIIKENTY